MGTADQSPDTTRPIADIAAAADWGALAKGLVADVGDAVAAQGHPTWVEVRPGQSTGNTGADVRLIPSESGFLGIVVSPECVAIGVVATGKVHYEESDVEPPVRLRPGTTPGARLCCIVARDGQTGWHMVMPDGTVIDQAPREGRLLDTFRRALDLPTPPPPVGSGQIQAIMWVASVLEQAQASPGQLSWREVIRLHPVVELLRDAGEPVNPDELPALSRIAANIWTWEFLRCRTEKGSWLSDLIAPEIAAWMDDGMFARWVLAELPDIDELVARVRHHLAPSAARRLAHAVRPAA